MQDHQHIAVCSTASVTGANQMPNNSANQLIGTASLIPPAPGGMVTLNHAANVSSAQIHNTGHLITPGSGLVGLGTGTTNASIANSALASASIGPLFTTAHFYHQPHIQDQSGQSQLHIQHALQQQRTHNSLQVTHHINPLSTHSAVHTQSPSTATVLLPGQLHPSTVSQINSTSPHQVSSQRHSNATINESNNVNASKMIGDNTGNCDGHSNNDECVHSTPNQTPLKSNDADLINQTSQLCGQSQNGNSGLDVSSSSTKRENSGTGHFVCGVCGREFGMRCRLIAHTRRHTGERPFPCADCGRAFSDRGNLQRHRYTHSSQPRFHCSVCGKSFRQASCLSNHRRFHCAGATGRPCPFCQRSFRSSSSLQMHIRWKHRADAAAAVAAAAAAAAASVSGSTDAFSYLPGLSSYVPTATMNGVPTMSLNGGSLGLQGSSLLSAAAAVAASAAIVNNGGFPTCMTNTVGPSHNTISTSVLAPTASCTVPSNAMNQLISANNSGSPNKRKWRRKPKPKQNAFGRLASSKHPTTFLLSTILGKRDYLFYLLASRTGYGHLLSSYRFFAFRSCTSTGDGMNILAGINLSEGIDVNAAAAAAGAAAAAVGGPVPLDRKGRPCNFPCPACPRRFAFQCRLAAHLRCHTNIRPFICIDCGRAFTQRGYLVRHAAVHKLDRPFSCCLCDRSYKHYGSLVNHKRTHSKLGASNLGNIALLSSTRLDQLGVDGSTTAVAGLSSLEEVVGGTVSQAGQTDASGAPSNSTTTITLLPVTKVEELLPGDLGRPLQQVCLPSLSCTTGNLMGIPDLHHSDAGSRGQSHSLPHQLTATAVWPILASGNPTSQAQMINSTNMPHPQPLPSVSHFPTLTLSPSQGIQSGQLNPQHQISLVPHQRQQLAQTNNNNTMLSAATASPAYVTVPLFSNNQPQSEPNESTTSALTLAHHMHHSFHTGSNLINTTSVPDVSHHHHTLQQAHSVAQPSQLTSHHLSSNQQQQQSSANDTNASSMLHVLQPSPSIFFSPYYLPHSAASQM